MILKDITVKNLVNYRRISDRRKKSFVKNLTTPKPKNTKKGGGDYWVRCIKAIGTAFKRNDISIVNERLDKLNEDIPLSDSDKTRNMRIKNATILKEFVDFDLSNWRPEKEISIISQPNDKKIIQISGLPIKIIPECIFSYEIEDKKFIGGIIFLVWKDGFKQSDLGIFSEAIFRYLQEHFSEDFTVDPDYCIAVDIGESKEVKYSQILNGDVPSELDSVLYKINDLHDSL